MKGRGFLKTVEGMKVMAEIKGYQRKYLRGIAHGMKAIVMVGQQGITPSVLKALKEALDQHELIKVKFVEEKSREAKVQMAAVLARETGSEEVGTIGHTALFYRENPDPELRKIVLPER